MGKRARKRGDSGKGTRQRYKERALGLNIAGISKPMLDAMNEVSLDQYGLGIGVLVQEEEHARKIVKSVAEELQATPRWRLFARRHKLSVMRTWRDELRMWSERLRVVAAAVAADTDSQVINDWAARRTSGKSS